MMENTDFFKIDSLQQFARIGSHVQTGVSKQVFILLLGHFWTILEKTSKAQANFDGLCSIFGL